MIKKIADFFIRPDFKSYDWINLTFYSTVLCLGALLGSFVSICVIGGAVFGTFHLATGRLKWALPRQVTLVFYAFCGFFAADLIAGIIHPSKNALNEILENLPFLGFAGIYAITFVDRRKLLQAVELTAAVAAIGSAIVTMVLFGSQYRPEMATGNASVLALLAGVLYVLAIGAAFRRRNMFTLLYLVAAACAGYVVLASGTRAIFPVLALVPVISLIHFCSRKQIFWGLPALLLLLGGISVVSVEWSATLHNRIELATDEIRGILSGDPSGSLGDRVRIYRAGYELFLDKPLLGYGPGNERVEITRKTSEDGGLPLTFSHAHNAALNALLRAGILGLLALIGIITVPFIVAFRATKDDVGQAGFHALNGLLVVYLSSGSVGLMIGHDIHDAVFITGICYSLYLVFGRVDKTESIGAGIKFQRFASMRSGSKIA